MIANEDLPHTILYVHPSDEMYGADVILLNLVKGLDRNWYKPVVVLPDDVPSEGELSVALHHLNIQVIHLDLAILRRRYFNAIGVVGYPWHLLRSALAIRRIIREQSIDIVHSNTCAVISGAIAASLTGRPHIWHIHEIIVRPRALFRLLSFIVPRLSDRVITVSEATRSHLILGDYLNRKSFVIHNGIDLTRFQPSEETRRKVRMEWNIKPNVILVGMVGRVSSWKGQDNFLKAATMVLEHYPQTRFSLVGGTAKGNERLLVNLRQKVSNLGLSDIVVVSDYRSDISSVLNALDIFILPSTQPDPFPTVVLEAMATGKPVIAPMQGGAVEMITNLVDGILVRPNDPSAIAKAIQYLIDNDTERLRLGKSAREHTLSRFSVKSFVDKWESLYRSIESS
jgi:glycosyltransferase involved in cell wall biosynthesis